MAIRPATQSKELITYKAAKEWVDAVAAKGVPLTNMREIAPTGQIVSVNDEIWFDDGTASQYVVTAWGVTDIEVGFEKVNLGAGKLNRFIGFAATVFVTTDRFLTYSTAVAAVLALKGITGTLDSALALPFPDPPADAPTDPTQPRNVINPPTKV